MTGFTELETGALQAIFSEMPELSDGLHRQLESASVVSRENSGGGFFTYIAVADDAPALDCPRVLAHETHAHVGGLEHGLGFVLFMEEGRLHLLEGYAYSPESTSSLDLERLTFQVYRKPAHG